MKHLSLKEKAYDMIKQKILNGDFEPGCRIMEDELAKEISMSRTPVREAINQLSAEGFVTNIPRKGIYFEGITRDEIRDLLDIRIVLEVLSVKKCAENAGPADIQALEENIRQFQKALEGKDYRKCNRLDSSFHRVIAQISGNRRLTKILGDIEEFMLITRSMEKKDAPQLKNDLTLQDHVEILEHIRAGEAEAAMKSMEKNIRRMRGNLLGE